MEVRRQRSTSRPRPVSRPTTPLRSSSRASIRDAHGASSGGSRPGINSLEPQFAELADSMADLEENFAHLQLMHESLSRFNESFASFLYGLNMNAFCVDFPETPIPESFTRFKQKEQAREKEAGTHPTNFYHDCTHCASLVDHELELQSASEQPYQSAVHDAETTFIPNVGQHSDLLPSLTKLARITFNVRTAFSIRKYPALSNICLLFSCMVFSGTKGHTSAYLPQASLRTINIQIVREITSTWIMDTTCGTRFSTRLRSKRIVDYTNNGYYKTLGTMETDDEDDEEDSEEEDDENDEGDDDMEAVEGEPILTMQQLMQYLQVDPYEFLNFLRSDMVGPWWEELYVNWIYPQQVAAKISNISSLPRPSMKDVRSRISQKEGDGLTTYSFPYPNRSKWKAVDHYARFYCHVKHWNIHNFDGMFYGQDVSKSNIEACIFSLLDVLINGHTPSRINHPSGGKAIYPNIARNLPEEAGVSNR
ncbi:DASH complex subunit dam1 [Microsporum audouinii]